MKLHHLRTAFLVICLLLVCSQGWATTFAIESNNEATINNNDTIINNTDPAVPEPTTLSLLTMSLLLVGRRWR
jgi:hypothetical protein